MNVIDSRSLERDAGGKPASGLSAAILRPKGNKKDGERSEVPAFPRSAPVPIASHEMLADFRSHGGPSAFPRAKNAAAARIGRLAPNAKKKAARRPP
jgi:hypothetical protein